MSNDDEPTRGAPNATGGRAPTLADGRRPPGTDAGADVRPPGDLPKLSRPFDDGLLALQITDADEPFAFARFAEELARAHDGEVVSRLTGLDEAYWDIRVRGLLLTLHHQVYLGVFLCATDEASEALLPELIPFASTFRPR